MLRRTLSGTAFHHRPKGRENGSCAIETFAAMGRNHGDRWRDRCCCGDIHVVRDQQTDGSACNCPAGQPWAARRGALNVSVDRAGNVCGCWKRNSRRAFWRLLRGIRLPDGFRSASGRSGNSTGGGILRIAFLTEMFDRSVSN